jgi:hypothetical protein
VGKSAQKVLATVVIVVVLKKLSYQIFTITCKPNLAYFTHILKNKLAQNDCEKTRPTILY